MNIFYTPSIFEAIATAIALFFVVAGSYAAYRVLFCSPAYFYKAKKWIAMTAYIFVNVRSTLRDIAIGAVAIVALTYFSGWYYFGAVLLANQLIAVVTHLLFKSGLYRYRITTARFVINERMQSESIAREEAEMFQVK